MRQNAVVALCGCSLVVGLAIGAGVSILPAPSSLHASGVQVSAIDKAYEELAQDTSPLQESSRLLARVADVTNPSVVHILSERSERGKGTTQETGSGVIMTSPKKSGFFVVTNRHVIEKARLEDISISLSDGRVLNPQEKFEDAQTDVAVLRITSPGLVAARWGDSNELDIGHMVLAMGSPFGLSRSVTLGIISAKGRRSLRLGGSEIMNQDFLQTDAAINPGNSGGPLIDLQGRVVGINTAIASSSGGNEGIGFSIPSNLVRRVMDQLLEYGTVYRAYLGVRLDNAFDAKTARTLRLDRVQGARVLEVYPNDPADRAGLKRDDVILQFDGVDVQDENHLINLVSLTPIGRAAKLTIWREGRKYTLSVTLSDLSQRQRATSEAPTEPGVGVPVRTMGLTVHPLDGDLAAELGHDRGIRGLLVTKVDEDGPLGSDVKMYDVIEQVGRQPTPSIGALQEAIERLGNSSSVVLQIRRSKSERGHREIAAELVVWRR